MAGAREGKPPKAEPAMLDVRRPADWERWLEGHHETTPEGVWLRLIRKAARPDDGLDQVAAVEAALCFGWIDGQAKPYDDTSWLQRFTPRRPAVSGRR